MLKKILQILIGKPRNPMDKKTRRNIALIAFLAWIGLGADGLSSSCYGPEEAFLAIQQHTHLALYLALVTALTVFLISVAYNQVIRLFPNGGGGYRVASKLIGPYAGLISGAALIIDYMLTIAISIASGTNAFFSFLPPFLQKYKLLTEIIILIILLIINLRGVKESIKLLLPIFVGFFITHVVIIILGIIMHRHNMSTVIHMTVTQTNHDIMTLGWMTVLGLFLRAYSLGSGTYTGIEAVSNNVHILAEPRTRTGAWAMFYMAVSLSVVASGIILLYLLWDVHPVFGKTLNAVAFGNILHTLPFGNIGVLILLFFEAGLLLVAANTGFLGGPAVLANMATDSWVPHRFALLSSRLVTQNGIMFFGIAALFMLLASKGEVSFLIILYSINVFITFSMSLLGLTKYWITHRHQEKAWLARFILAFFTFLVCIGVLAVMLITKFDLGGWITIVITSTVIIGSIFIRQRYKQYAELKKKLNQELRIPLTMGSKEIKSLNPEQSTAVFFVKEVGAALHSILWAQRMFPDYFYNIIFISHGELDMGNFGSDAALEKLKLKTESTLNYLVQYAQQNNFAAESYVSYGTDPIDHLCNLSEKVINQYPNAIFFSTRYVYPIESLLMKLLHSDFSNLIQRRLHLLGIKMLILPLNLKI